ncbi:cytochrome ubiquinol oxidase subunit I [Boudabousia marimammalium]|uniref:Cytochrome ubiquinol oxidase subunit I n=1 Tax=Boudabousia marimammalium TaxID=156892 RepID=A0A1Q5PR75_9ACTO|nr:cytochrome ubiquinol oxidase subunit I [Boudabousia marimammalium]OKL49900.1 cytochrome ubiquinol oxidase subunit I [Boudabousia marimammalium]
MFMPTALDALEIARWQFGITTVYHFVLVPLTIGLSPMVALMETLWLKTQKEHWLKATRFFGKLFLINMALGVATGIVQEFQFGMNWSQYSLMVGDIFGAPLAIEALLAFFMESTFIGLWIFGWGKLSKRTHALMIWLVAIGVNFSALWILGANSWMQHPVGAELNPATGRFELTGTHGFLDVVANPKLWITFTHVLFSSWMVAGAFIAGLAVWWMVRAQRAGEAGEVQAREIWRPISKFGLVVLLIGSIGTVITGDLQGVYLTKEQPGKMAAAEALCETQAQAPFTVAGWGDCLSEDGFTHIIQIPGMFSLLATHDMNAEVTGVKNFQEESVKMWNQNETFVKQYGDASQYQFTPNNNVTFWTFRLMIYVGMLSAIFALIALWLMRKGRVPNQKWLGTIGLLAIPTPFLGASFGWIFTEMGRQPWIVVPNFGTGGDPVGDVFMMTQAGVSGSVSAGAMLTTLIIFTLLYAALGVVWFWLIRRYALEGISTTKHSTEESHELSFSY